MNFLFLFVVFTVKREPLKSKEELDKELEQYMVNTGNISDRELGIYGLQLGCN